MPVRLRPKPKSIHFAVTRASKEAVFEAMIFGERIEQIKGNIKCVYFRHKGVLYLTEQKPIKKQLRLIL